MNNVTQSTEWYHDEDTLRYGTAAFVLFVTMIVTAIRYVIKQRSVNELKRLRNLSLARKIYIITGANRGIGFETAKLLVQRNATVIMACRSLARAEKAIKKIKAETGKGRMIPFKLDLEKFETIVNFAKFIKRDFPKFDCLINNAGVSKPTGLKTTINYVELHYGTNYLGHFFLTRLLLNGIIANSARVVIVSSLFHEDCDFDVDTLCLCAFEEPYSPKWGNEYYIRSKFANFYHAHSLTQLKIDTVVYCPGYMRTNFISDYIPRWYNIICAPFIWIGAQTAAYGAKNIIFCATEVQNTDEENPANGYYIDSMDVELSKAYFDEEEAKELWDQSEAMCDSVLNYEMNIIKASKNGFFDSIFSRQATGQRAHAGSRTLFDDETQL
ncbi:retinol dehydrogenase 14-like [Contarinia nasturtii]|uniref:retinol dehydrogenase 14-like n=1 Tax=Contarinia nasturtii TaxID=265458 RepID=UPI0012D4B1C0|nr:retinol dehydrogenase 14-like [Contarinia nasturtii]